MYTSYLHVHVPGFITEVVPGCHGFMRSPDDIISCVTHVSFNKLQHYGFLGTTTFHFRMNFLLHDIFTFQATPKLLESQGYLSELERGDREMRERGRERGRESGRERGRARGI